MCKTKYITEPVDLYKLLTDDTLYVTDVNYINDDMLCAKYEQVRNFVLPTFNTLIVIACYTTAHARLKLYSYLEPLDQ
jgi:hypothetical protein